MLNLTVSDRKKIYAKADQLKSQKVRPHTRRFSPEHFLGVVEIPSLMCEKVGTCPSVSTSVAKRPLYFHATNCTCVRAENLG